MVWFQTELTACHQQKWDRMCHQLTIWLSHKPYTTWPPIWRGSKSWSNSILPLLLQALSLQWWRPPTQIRQVFTCLHRSDLRELRREAVTGHLVFNVVVFLLQNTVLIANLFILSSNRHQWHQVLHTTCLHLNPREEARPWPIARVMTVGEEKKLKTYTFPNFRFHTHFARQKLPYTPKPTNLSNKIYYL